MSWQSDAARLEPIDFAPIKLADLAQCASCGRNLTPEGIWRIRKTPYCQGCYRDTQEAIAMVEGAEERDAGKLIDDNRARPPKRARGARY